MNNTSISFLGIGWSFPPSFDDQGGYLQMTEGTDDIRQSLEILITTHAGERIMMEGFGCAMDHFVFEDLSQHLVNDISSSIQHAILHYEPRIRLEKVDISEDTNEPGRLLISVDYSVKSLNARENLVFPFYHNEGRLTGLQ